MHDASEAYLGDLIGPLKRVPDIAAAYGPIEAAWQTEICKRFGVDQHRSSADPVKHADLLALELERRANLTRGPVYTWWGTNEDLTGLPPLDLWSEPELVREKFLKAFDRYRP
jgi:hypothetical protein